MNRPEVVVYTRQGCGLCAAAEARVAAEARGGRIHHVDVDTDPELVTRYGVRVPVVLVDGLEVAELELEPGTVRRAVRAARRARLRRSTFRHRRRRT
ncbi:MAG: glutaredoxin family protein [Nitriliruptoraceae bacterium]